jgi:prophage antirepressor-like protein
LKSLEIFENPVFGKIRMVDVNGKPHAVGIDVARVLEYANPSKAVIQHCKGITKLGIPSEGGIQETNVIPEGDIYRLIVKAADQSQNNVIKDKAEKFGSWLFDEVLPSIRQGGSYSIQEATDTLPQIEVDMIATKYTIDILKPSEAGKINLISKV